ncbi:MAG TPA: universal stress protein [Streptosporangiaceae bacterium]|nr:universal stress protein [Streptosporangiaceae bacterium]
MIVIVGVEGLSGSRASIRLAAREATYRGSNLIAVITHSTERAPAAPAARPPGSMRTATDGQVAAETQLRDAVVDALGERAPQVELRVLPGLAGRVLVDLARDRGAELIVLAARNTDAHLLGDMSQYVLRHAPCPVLIVPDDAAVPDDTEVADDLA